jgi:ABC-type Fe3+/spermidine/putrescine transport system ATPase subunit
MPGQPHIEVENLEISYGKVPAVRGVSFTVQPGEQLTLLGPSGCGKTTTLRAVAGLEQPTAGEIRIGGAPVYSSARKINVPAEKRGLSMVFQSYAIWPHMTVFENVAYGLRVRRAAAVEITEKVHSALDMVQMRDFAARRASQLSGGQQQRVALARAFVFQPSVLLFDEPLSNLDAKLRADMRIELRDLQHRLGITSLYVTHDLEEALAMSDRIVVMRDGLVEQTGTPDEIYRLPRSAFVADFIGSANLIRGRNRLDLSAGDLIALETADGQVMYGMACGRAAGAELTFSVRTVHLQISGERPPGDKNVWPVRVEKTVFQGDFSQLHIVWGTQRLIARCAAMEPIAPGSEVFMTVDPRRAVLLGV